MGFIGSNLAVRLVEAGATVSIVDSSVEGCGANPFNVADVGPRLRLIPLDIGEAADFAGDLRRCDLIFNLAGEISHTESMRLPQRDLALNAAAQLRFLDVCRRVRPGVRIVFASTRQVYGRPVYLPVDELHPLQPIDFNGIHKWAAAEYHRLITRLGELDAIVLRLTNVFGPRMALNLPCQGFMATFIRAAVDGAPITVYGNGRQLRDPVFVDDVVDAFLIAGAAERPPSMVYNVGGPEPLSLTAIAEGFARAGGHSTVRCIPFPANRKAIDIGSYYTNSARIRSELGWEPSTSFGDGVERTIQYYRRHRSHYLDEPAAEPVCGPGKAEAANPAAVR